MLGEITDAIRGAAFQLAEFHRQALAPGSIPLPALGRIPAEGSQQR